MKTILTVLILLLSLPAHAQDLYQEIHQEMLGRWKGTVRIQESSCKTSIFRQSVDLRVAPHPREDTLLTGRTPARRYMGIVWAEDAENGVTVDFASYAPYRLSNGKVCTLEFKFNFVDYYGGNRAYVEATQEVTCFGHSLCKKVMGGVLRKARGKRK